MAIVLFLSIAIICVLSFSVTKRKIHLFEGIIIWAFFLQIHNNFVGIVGIDFQLFKLSQKLDNFLAYCSIRSIIIPILIFLFIEFNSTFNETWKKLLCWIAVIQLIIVFEYMADLMGVIHYSKKWNIGWSYIYWTSTILLTFLVHKIIRYYLRKDVII